MNRAIVLLVCLSAAAGIVAYSHHEASERAIVVTVTQRAPEAVVRAPVAPPPRAIETPADRASLARELQRELKRVGCYGGEVNGVWTTSSRMAMKAFTDRANATLPIDQPDYILLSLVKGHKGQACGTECPTGQTAAEAGACTPNAVNANAGKSPAAKETKLDASPEKSSPTLASSAPTAAAAAIAAAAAVSTAEPRPKAPDERARAAAMTPPAQETAPPSKTASPERSAGHGGPVPPDSIRERGPRRSADRAKPQPPKFVRNFLRSLGFR